MKCLVTGGAGFIGAHTIIALMGRGIQPVVVDNFCNASLKNIKAVEAITGKKIVLKILMMLLKMDDVDDAQG